MLMHRQQDVFAFADDLGPEKVVHIHVPAARLKAIVVIDNVAAGPAIGGTRMAPDVSAEECFRLARAMTFKNAAMGLPHGGAKSVIFGDPKMPDAAKEQLIRAFAGAIAPLTDYIPGPDMGTNETAMAWVHDEIARAVGLPREFGGIPLDEIGATGFGVAVAAEVAAPYCGVTIENARLVVEGFGAVGQHAARFLTRKGARLVGVSDSRGAVVDPNGIAVEALADLKRQGKSVIEHARAKRISPDDLVAVECDIWIPAARPDVLRSENVERLNCKLVVQGANIPATPDAELRMHERGILNLPDFIANAGGVIAAAVEYAGGTEAAALVAIEDKIRRNTRDMLEKARQQGMTPRAAALDTTLQRLRTLMNLRRWH